MEALTMYTIGWVHNLEAKPGLWKAISRQGRVQPSRAREQKKPEKSHILGHGCIMNEISDFLSKGGHGWIETDISFIMMKPGTKF